MKRVLIIYTGGTIGMTRTENGYAPRAGYFAAAGFIQHDRARMELHRRADRAEI